jgi:hypothetical protein
MLIRAGREIPVGSLARYPNDRSVIVSFQAGGVYYFTREKKAAKAKTLQI